MPLSLFPTICNSLTLVKERHYSNQSRARFLRTLGRLCMNRVRSLLRMCVLLLRCSFESRPNSCALSTVGSIITIGSSMNGCSHLKNNSFARENKIDWSRRLGGGDLRQSLLFSSLLKKTKVGSARAGCCGVTTTTTTTTTTTNTGFLIFVPFVQPNLKTFLIR